MNKKSKILKMLFFMFLLRILSETQDAFACYLDPVDVAVAVSSCPAGGGDTGYYSCTGLAALQPIGSCDGDDKQYYVCDLWASGGSGYTITPLFKYCDTSIPPIAGSGGGGGGGGSGSGGGSSGGSVGGSSTGGSSGSGSGGGGSGGGSSGGSSNGCEGACCGGGGSGQGPTAPGSVVQPESHTVGENVGIVGTPFYLSYASNRATNRKSDRSITIPITKNPVATGLVSVDIQVVVAGKTETIRVSDPGAGQVYVYEWDGKDASNQPVWGEVEATVSVTENYSPAKAHVYPRNHTIRLRNFNVTASYVGGWSISIHHFYEPTAKILYFGGGGAAIMSSTTVSGNLRVPNSDGSELYIFNTSGRHLSTLNGLKGTTKYTFGYDGSGRLVTITDAYSNVTTVARDGSGNPTTITAPYGQVTTLGVNGQGILNSIENPAGEEYTMAYFNNGLLYTFTNPRGVISTMTYDNLDRLISDVSSAGNSLDFLIESFTSGAAYGLRTSMTTAEGVTTAYSREDYVDGTSQVGKTTVSGTGMGTMVFESRNSTSTKNLTSIKSMTPAGMIYDTTFQDHPRLGASVRFPNSFSYSDGFTGGTVTRSSSVILNNPADIFDIDEMTALFNQNGKTTTVVYDGVTSKFTTTSPEGLLSYVTIDSNERVTELQEASFHPIEYTYDSDGRVEKIEHTASRPTEYTYNGSGFISKVKNALNEETSFTYDLAGRVLTQTLPDSRVVTFTYDSNGNMTSVTPPGRPTHDMTYNNYDLLSGYLTVSATSYSYNNDRQITLITRPNLDTISYTYSSLRGRLTGISTSAGNYTVTQNSAGWDFPDQVVSPDGVTTAFNRKGDNLYEVISWGTTEGKVTTNLNSNYNISAIQVKTETPYNLTYDNDSRLISIGSETLTRSSAHGKVTKATVGNAYEDFTYSGFGELSSITGKYNSTHIYSGIYTRDDLGRVSTHAETYGAGATQNIEYLYDSAGRLSDVKHGGVTVASYTYDSNSNRLSATTSGGTVYGTYTDYDQLINYGTKSYTYNNNGELTQVVDSAAIPIGVYSFSYDTFGNLKTVTLPNSDVISYVLDGLQRRTGVKLNGTLQKQYVWQDRMKIVAELDSTGSVVAEFIYGTKINVPDYMKKSGSLYKIMTNHIGSVVAVINTSTGSFAQEIKYDVFGNILSDSNPGFQPFAYAGGLYDQNSKLLHFGAREYDAEVGRWTSKDPIFFSGGDTNLYGYTANDPVNFIDPMGLWRWPGSIYDDATRDAGNSGLPGAHNGLQDAYRHCLASCMMTQENGNGLSEVLGDLNEKRGDWWRNQEFGEKCMDLANNRTGRDLGKSGGNCAQKCMAAATGGQLTTYPGGSPGYWY